MMWLTSAACILCVFVGITCDVKQVHSQPAQDSTLDDNIQRLINQIHSLSSPNENTHSFTTADSSYVNSYYSVLSNLFALLRPLFGERFMGNFTTNAVCLLSGRQDCGLEAELTRAVSVELVQPLLTFVSSLSSQTCPPLSSAGPSGGFLASFFGTEEPAAAASAAFQQTLDSILSAVPLSASLLDAISSFTDLAVTYLVNFTATLLQTPMDYIRIALQFGLKIPHLDGKETCEEGDLAQLIMWGMNNNVSWSFTDAILDIFLEVFLASDQSPCPYPGPECQNPGFSFQRSASLATGNRELLLSCDRHNLAGFNDTLCADVLAGSEPAFPSVLGLCRALSVLSPTQMEQVWSNACYVLQALASPLLTPSPACDGPLPPTVTPGGPLPPAVTPAPGRVARGAPSLTQLACDYGGWLGGAPADPVLVGLCSDNERQAFVDRVCGNASLMRKLLSDQTNVWLYAYCANSSADPGYMAAQFCVYEQWLSQPMVPVGSALLEFCMALDRSRLVELICGHTGFFMLLFTNPDNLKFLPNCTNVPLVPLPDINAYMLDACRYSDWQLAQVTTDVLLQCIRLDQNGFALKVCTNETFLNGLLQIQANYWLQDHCTAALTALTTEPAPVALNGWCDYSTWGNLPVDVSVVGLCWEVDKVAFQQNVCCKAPVYEKLLQDPLNTWLLTACAGIVESELLPQVCRYSDWTRPIIVDMTEVALCAEIDPLNFTAKVCSNYTVLQNLLANQDNTWLIQHCANFSKPPVPPNSTAVTPTGRPTAFKAPEQCQYPSWSVSPPDITLLTLCWEHDQTNFVSFVCPNAALLSQLSQELSSKWVSPMCTTYANYSTAVSGNSTGAAAEPFFCLAKNLVSRFNWSCSADLHLACQPGPSQNLALQKMLRCWADSLRSRAALLLPQPAAALLERTLGTTVVILLALEEAHNKSLHVAENIRFSVLGSVVRYLENEDDFEKKRVVLQCFGTVLTSLMQTPRDATSEDFLFIKEYLKIPLGDLSSVLSSADVTTIRLILQYYSINKNTLQLSDQYLSTMTSVLLQNHLVKDGSLFPDLAPLLTSASLTDIQALPTLQNNVNVIDVINRNLAQMTMEQREAFGSWYNKVMASNAIATGGQSFIRNAGNLIAYLPFYNFQHLTSAQLFDGLDVLQRNTLTPLKRVFVAQSIIGSYRNLTAQDFIRLGNLTCLADPNDILVYKDTEAFSVIQDIVENCSRAGLSLPSSLISNVLLTGPDLKAPSSLGAARLAQLAAARLLPWLSLSFLQGLTPSQLLAALPALSSVSFSPAQASLIIDKVSSVTALTAPGQLQELGSLIVGVRTEMLLTLTSDKLLSSLPAMAQHVPGLSLTQANAVATKLWGFPEVVNWLDDVDPLLYCTPLLSILARTHLLVKNITATSTKRWNTQQAEAIFTEVLNTNSSLVKQRFLSLGTLGQGVSCTVLQERIEADTSRPALRRILLLLRQQPVLLHTSLKNCLLDELYLFDFFPNLLKDLGAEIALYLQVSTIKKFSTSVMDTLRQLIVQDPRPFLLLPRTKQELLVDKIVQRMGMYTGAFTEQEFRSLGVMASFVADEVFDQLDRSFFTASLGFLRGFCYSSSKMDILARILQEPATFGPVNNWNQTTLNQVDWFLLFLPNDELQDISLALMTVGRIERLFLSHRQWERGAVGSHCWSDNEKAAFFQKQQFVLQFFLGFLILNFQTPTIMVPTCEMLQTTLPAAWPPNTLTSMPTPAFLNCLELMGQDSFLASYQRSQLLKKVKQIYGPASSLSQSVIAQLGVLALEMTEAELSSLRLTERRSIAAMGAISAWSSRQLAALFTTILISTKQSPSQLDSSTLVSLGYIVCGAKSTDMSLFNAIEFSKAVLQLGRLTLSCSEDQLAALVGLLTNSLAFGPISSWGTDVFIEIGVMAAGLPDLAMSALVKEQIEGITPSAISMIQPSKFGVVFSQTQISMFSYEQAAAVTNEQLAVLSDLQRTALAMVLTPWEDKPVDFRAGMSLGLALSHSPVCLTLGLLMLLIIVTWPDPI
ncbi:stereocilin [Betta splendens]|uniref:Stereocilin n=1 Tax=Betta splendens TaxID=158456 RepID=A0A6P7LZX2_BETSP|nr:stereocilin [Betta splendens]